ncbi:MAG TPA: nitrous oxide reductase accessory protein NosL [Vicinamibacterales bacterium]|nr:nitrous oxide reductase accessory protein NosL [Vicinamibacterales bacterium]
MRLAFIVFAVLAAAGCRTAADGPPAIEIDRSACSHCGMLISERIYAAAYQAADSDARVFDDIGCLVAAARKEERRTMRFWFHDAADGGWIDGSVAAFAVSPAIRTPMGGGILAYRDLASATAAARQHRGEAVATLGGLLQRRGERR